MVLLFEINVIRFELDGVDLSLHENKLASENFRRRLVWPTGRSSVCQK